MLTFYDVVIDFIFFDAFDDLENPPATLLSVMQNRWLTSGFKEMVSHNYTLAGFYLRMCKLMINRTIIH